MANPAAQTVIDLEVARRKTSFEVREVRAFLHDGLEGWKRHETIVSIISGDPVFSKDGREFMTRGERYKKALAIGDRLCELRETHNWSTLEANKALEVTDETSPIRMHKLAFEPVILSQGSPDLLAKYADLTVNRGILGCYLQTELGHGTNVSRLETTATYLSASKEFEIHSPTLTSTKWWIGALGKTATHGVVQARLILPGGKDVGPHLFLVQLRSLHDHKVLPGIVIGDIGPKAFAGFAAMDNGFARFSHVRIPKENMLAKFAQVTDGGEYVRPPHAKLSYGGMLDIRSGMVTSAGWLLAKAATISVRYCTVRRQGEIGLDGLERQVISYPSVHYRLLPILSRAFVFILLGRKLSSDFKKLSALLSSNDTSLLTEMHALTSGLKVLASTAGIQDLETARRAMGGHGYSAFAGVGRIYADWVPSATFEGDNFVLDQQVVRAALKAYKSMIPSTSSPDALFKLSPSSNYLRLLLPSVTRRHTLPKISLESWGTHRVALELLEWRAAAMVQDFAKMSLRGEGAKLGPGVQNRISRAIAEAYVAARVSEMIETGLGESGLKGSENKVVGDLLRLYLLVTVESTLTDLLSYDLYQVSDENRETETDRTHSIRSAISELLDRLLPDVIGLTDSFGFSDFELNSALGVWKGDVYEHLWESAQKEPLNAQEVPDGYEEYIKPTLRRGQRLSGKAQSKL